VANPRSASTALATAAVILLAAGCGGGRHSSSGQFAALARLGPTPPIASDRIYFVMTDRYANGDRANDEGGLAGGPAVTGYDPTSTAYFHGGDFKGLTGTCSDRRTGLARIRDLGFNAIWITPPFGQKAVQGTSAAYHGYWIENFEHVDPHLGTDADFGAFVRCAHRLGMRVIVDIVVNHTADVIQLAGAGYSARPYRDCHGKAFDPARYAAASTFPCLSATSMPRLPVVPTGERNAKSPAWLNDPLDYHDRGDLSLSGPCDETCLEQGDFFGLDDLFTEKPAVMNGLARIYSDWIRRYKIDGFRIDTARYVNAAFFRLWAPKIMAAARAAGVPGFRMFGEVTTGDDVQLASFVRERGLPNALDFPFQADATQFVAGRVGADQLAHRLSDDDYFRRADGAEPFPVTFLGNHDMGRAAFQVQSAGAGFGSGLLRPLELAYDLLYLLRGAPVVYYGDEVGMIGTGGDQEARQDMFATQVSEWRTQPRVGSSPIGAGSSFDVTNNPLEAEMRQLAALRDANPALATGWTITRYAQGGVLVVSRIDPFTRSELVAGFNASSSGATVTVPTSTAGTWTPLLGRGGTLESDRRGALRLAIPPVGAVLLEANELVLTTRPPKPKLTVKPDDLSNLFAATATVTSTALVSVAFAVLRAGSHTWRRLDVDTSPPFRGFLEPWRFKRHERVQVVAVARGLDGSTAVSQVVTLTLP
jgi:alpha-amylase